MEMNSLSPESRSMTGSDLSHDLSSPGTPAKREYSLEDEETDLSDSEEVELLRRQLRTRKGGQTALCSTRNVLTALLVGSAGFLLGNISRGTISNAPTSGFYSPLTHGKTGRCNAYQQIGVLQVNLNTSRENKWIPLDSNCTPTDYLSKFSLPHTSPDLDFVRNKTVVMLGDSVDRGNLVQFCLFTGGALTIIDKKHKLSPPLPLGLERPKFPNNLTYGDNNDTDWANNINSRPTVCIHEKYKFKITSTFFYGHQLEEDENESTEYFLRRRTHYYPPTNLQQRILQITKPVLHSIGASAYPDLVTISATFWDTFRHVMEDDKTRKALEALDKNGDYSQLKPGVTMKKSRRDTIAKRIEEIIDFIGETWSVQEGRTARREPTIVWRTLHHTQPHRITPVSAIEAADQIGRATILRLNKKRKAPIRLVDWGGHILGQEKHSYDAIHPLPLPSGWLWGNMFLDELERDHVRRQ